jgi:hypothetical protein
MKKHMSLVAAGAASLLGAGAFLLPAAASTHHGAQPACGCTVHKLRFISVTKHDLEFSATNVAQQDTDVTKAGKTIGFDDLNLSFNPKTGAGSGNFSFDTRGGFINGTLRLSQDGATGKLTGGTGKYRGVTGTIVARNLNKAGTRTGVTITYRLP